MPEQKLSQKINASSMQVIKTLLTLMQGDYSMNDLVEQLNMNEAEPIYKIKFHLNKHFPLILYLIKQMKLILHLQQIHKYLQVLRF